MAKDITVKIALEVKENFTDKHGNRYTRGDVAFLDGQLAKRYIKEGLVKEQEFELGNTSAHVDMSQYVEIDMYRELSDRTQLILKENQQLKEENKQLTKEKNTLEKNVEKLQKENEKKETIVEEVKLEKEKKTSKAKK